MNGKKITKLTVVIKVGIVQEDAELVVDTEAGTATATGSAEPTTQRPFACHWLWLICG